MNSKTTDHSLKQKYQLKRLASSPYHGDSFKEGEMKMVESLGISYSSQSHHGHDYHYDFYISNTHYLFKEKEVKKFNKKTKLLIHPNSGYDNFSCEFVKNAHFPIIIGNRIRAKAVAEYILSCLFNHLTILQKDKEWNHQRSWNRQLIQEHHIAIIGYGHIGKILKSSLEPLSKNLTIIDPFKDSPKSIPQRFDVIVLASSLNKTSYQIINQSFLKNYCHNHLLIINGARGKLIEQNDLITHLKQNSLSFAYLDVFEKEPSDFKVFEKLENVQLSSHVAGVSCHLDQLILKFEKEVLKDFLTLTKKVFLKRYHDEILQNKIHRTQDDQYLI